MIGDLAGHKVRVTRPKPEHEDARGLEGLARHAKFVDQGGLPTDREADELESHEVQYYLDALDSDEQSLATSRMFGHSELEIVD